METFLLPHNSSRFLLALLHSKQNNGEAPEIEIERSVFFQCPELLHSPPFSSSGVQESTSDMDSLATDPGFIASDVYLRLGLLVEGKRLKKPPTVLSRLASSLERSLFLHDDDKILIESPDMEDSVTVFDGISRPEISIAHYLDRIFKYSCCSPSCFVIAHIYIHQFLQRTRALLKPLNVHRLIITSVMLAAKVFDDRYFNNAYYARVGGVSTRELNRLEMKLLFTLDFKLQVDPQTFHTHCCQLEKQNSDGFQIEWPIKEACRANKETWQKRTPDSVCSQTTAR